MPNIRLNFKRISVLLTAFLLMYVFFSSGDHNYHIEGIIGKASPETVWEYVADFSKMRLLNPTIINFKILSDHGHAHEWHYTVRYTERLSHWPHWVNKATAHYVVTKTMPNIKPPEWAIKSSHETCFFGGFYCLNSVSNFRFSAIGADTYAQENIQYQCPRLLTGACRRELEFQRRAVFHNLTHIFRRT